MTTVAVIGAGLSGLTAAKAALECGLKPTIFERAKGIGGLWNPNGGSTWDSLHTNISHLACMFSDFPWKKDCGLFPHRDQVYDYLNAYAKVFNLEPHLRLNTTVSKVSQLEDHRWQVITESARGKETQIFDRVIVATGIFAEAMPLAGLERFQGSVVHGKEYKNPESFRGKTVAVLGSAFSGCEIAAELAGVAKKVVHVVRRVPWIIPKEIPDATGKKQPLDQVFFSRHFQALSKGIPLEQGYPNKHAFLSRHSRQASVCPALAVNTPTTEPAFIAITDTYLPQVEAGHIEVVQQPVTFEGNSIKCSDGREQPIDVLIPCNGYKLTFPSIKFFAL